MRTSRVVMLSACLVALIVFVPMRKVAELQQQLLIQLADSAGNTQTMRAATLGNFTVSTTLTGRNVSGVQLISKPSSWAVSSYPAANSQGTASIAAEAAVRHVADCVSWGAAAAAAVTAADGNVAIRDGATGAGTVIWQIGVAHLAAAAAGIQTIAPHSYCGLNLVGSTNVAMTAEFNAGVTGEHQGINLSGYNVQ